jgi:diguanylate cyclase
MHRPDARRGLRVDPLLVVLAVLALITAVGFALQRATTVAQVATFWLLMAAVHACFAVTSWRVAARSRPSGRHLWSLFAIAGAAFLVGDAGQLVEVARHPAGPSAVVGTSFQFGALAVGVTVLVTGLLRFPLGTMEDNARSRLRLDVATVLAAATTFGLWLFEVPAGDRGGGWFFGLVTAILVLPGMFLVATFAVVRLILSGRTPFTRLTAVTGGTAAVMQVVLQAVPGSIYQDPRFMPWLLCANVLASTLLAVAARSQERGARHARQDVTAGPRRRYSILPYAAMVAVWLLTALLLAVEGLDTRAWVVGLGAVVTTVLVIGRQVSDFRAITELLDERDKLTTELSRLAYHDALTGLANRGRFMQRLHDALAAGPVTVFLVDLDDFKPVNDAFGHATGDQLLIEVGRRLRAEVRDGDTVGRLGGDEFAVLMEGLPVDRRKEVADGLSAALSGTVRIGAVDVGLSASVGSATGRQGLQDPDSLLHEADMAMYAVKTDRRILVAGDLV